MIHSVLNSLLLLDYNLVILNNINLDIVVVINPMRACKTEVETTEHFLLRFHFYRLKY